MSKKYYAVKKGRNPGIYTDWDSCEKEIKGFSGACFQGFKTQKEAIEFLGDVQYPSILPTPPKQNISLTLPNPPKQNITLPTPPKQNISLTLPNPPKQNITLPTPPKQNITLPTPPKQNITLPTPPKQTILEIYTDGSHFKHGDGYKGFGAFTVFNGKEYRMSGHCDEETIKRYNIHPSTNFSNPTAEFMAFAEVLRILVENVKSNNKYFLLFRIDFLGVGNWMKGEWKAKEAHIKNIKLKADEYFQKLKNMGWTIDFKHVKGHSGNYSNDQTDYAAKSRESFDEFTELAKIL